MIRLLPLKEENLERYLNWRNDPRVYQWCRQYEPLDIRSHKRWFDSLLDRSDVKMYEIVSHNLCVGVCGLTDIDYINSRAEFSLYIGPEHWRNNYGRMGLLQLLHKGFDVLGLNLIWGETFEGNPAINLFEKIGFKRDGIRTSFYRRGSTFINAILISMLKEDFCREYTKAEFRKT